MDGMVLSVGVRGITESFLVGIMESGGVVSIAGLNEGLERVVITWHRFPQCNCPATSHQMRGSAALRREKAT